MIAGCLIAPLQTAQEAEHRFDVSPLKTCYDSAASGSIQKKVVVKKPLMLRLETSIEKEKNQEGITCLGSNGISKIDQKFAFSNSTKELSRQGSPSNQRSTASFKQANVKKIQISSTHQILSGKQLREEVFSSKQFPVSKGSSPSLKRCGTMGSIDPIFSNYEDRSGKPTLSKLRTLPANELESLIDSPSNKLSNFELILREAFRDEEESPQLPLDAGKIDKSSHVEDKQKADQQQMRETNPKMTGSPNKGQVFFVRSMSKYLEICNKAKKILGGSSKSPSRSKKLDILTKLGNNSPEPHGANPNIYPKFGKSSSDKETSPIASTSPNPKQRNFKISHLISGISRPECRGTIIPVKVQEDIDTLISSGSVKRIPRAAKLVKSSTGFVQTWLHDTSRPLKPANPCQKTADLNLPSPRIHLSPVSDSPQS